MHFLYGLLVTPAAVEIFAHYGRYARPWAFLLPCMFMAGHSVVYETIEFAAALAFGGDLGQAYLGTQGDVWDSQKDMALAMLGTTLMLTVLAAAKRLPVRMNANRNLSAVLASPGAAGEGVVPFTSGGLEGKRRRPAAALARAFDLDGAAPECPLIVGHERQRRALTATPGIRRLALRDVLQFGHGE